LHIADLCGFCCCCYFAVPFAALRGKAKEGQKKIKKNKKKQKKKKKRCSLLFNKRICRSLYTRSLAKHPITMFGIFLSFFFLQIPSICVMRNTGRLRGDLAADGQP
jgi:hypothetical protein